MTTLGGAAIAIVLLTPTEALAHGGTPGSAASPLSLVLGVGGLALLVAGGILSSRRFRRTGLTVFVTGVALIALAGADIATDSSQVVSSPARIDVLRPLPGEVVSSPVRFSVQLTGASLIGITESAGPPEAGHLHVYVDGKVVDMVGSTEFAVPMSIGRHIVQIEFTGADHMSFDPAVQAVVEVDVASPNSGATTTTTAEPAGGKGE